VKSSQVLISKGLRNWLLLKAIEGEQSPTDVIRQFMLYKGAQEIPTAELVRRAKNLGRLELLHSMGAD
jgi:hypothetical protein